MGKKKSSGQSQAHLQQSVGSLVSKAALSQMGPQIEQMVRHYVQNLGNQLAVQQASTLETLFARVVVLESIIMEKLGYSSDDLTNKVATLEDEKEGLQSADTVETNDVVRLEISTKKKEQTEYQGTSRMKVYNTGAGQNLGLELEGALIGMKAGETKEVAFAEEGKMIAKLTVNRVSRPVKTETPQEASNDNQSEG